MARDVTFRHPPVVETVLSVQFERLDALSNACLGAFWQERRSAWPRVSDASPLDEQFETFGRQPGWDKGIHLKLTQSPAGRIQMRSAAGDRMIQLQNCRLDYNWIGQAGQEYPRYRAVRPEFDEVLAGFERYIREHDLGQLTANQWEVTYVNQMPEGTVWQGPEEWPGVFRSLPGLAVVPDGLRLEGLAGHWHFEIEPRRGRLHVALQHAYVGGDPEQEALVMKLTARGPIDRQQNASRAIDDGLDLGHDVIVESFEELTSPRAHEYWNREVEHADG